MGHQTISGREPESRPRPGTPQLRFGLLGPLTLQDALGANLALRTPKSQALLAALLLEPNRPVPFDRVERALWGEQPPATARNALYNHVAQVRRALGIEGAARLQTVPSGYLLRVREGELDTESFNTHLNEARAAHQAEDWDTAARSSDAALALWRGDPLVDLPGVADQYLPYLGHLHEARIQALQLRLDARLALGGGHDAIPELTRLTAEHPLSEAFHQQLMLALYRAGRQGEALGVYERIRAVLAEELGIDPGSGLREMHQRILMSDPGLTATRQVPVLGSSSADADADQQSSERGVAKAFTPARPVPVPSQLPGTPADFSGRRTETAFVLGELSRTGPGTPIVAVTGVAGIGKTTLAVYIADQAADHFPDGTLYVDLQGFGAVPREPADVLTDFLRDLGMTDDAIPAGQEARAAAFRTLVSDRRVLLVLDNALDAAQVRPLLPGGAGCAVLVTARRELPGLAGVVRVGLDRLDEHNARALFTGIVGDDRVRSEPVATAEVLTFCAGLPLALRIAAGRLACRPSWNVATMAAKLVDERRRLDELQIDDVAVRASFQMSYANPAVPGCPDGSRLARAFRLLGLAPGTDIGVGAASALLDEGLRETEQLLEELVDSCLLESPAPGRYRLHDLLRVFAIERVHAEETDEVRQAAVARVTRWYLRALIAADAVLFPNAGRPTSLESGESPGAGSELTDFRRTRDWCETERANIVHAARTAADYGLHDIAWRFVGFGWAFLGMQSHWEDWQSLADVGLSAARACGDPAAEAMVLTSRAALSLHTWRLATARDDLTRALAIREDIGDQPGQLACLSTLGMVLLRDGEIEKADEHLRRALALAGTPDLRQRQGAVLANLARCAMAAGDWQRALARGEKSVRIYREFGGRGALADMLTLNGAVLVLLGRTEEAVEPLQEALTLAEAVGAPVGHARALAVLSHALRRLGLTQEAQLRAGETQDMAGRIYHREAVRVRMLMTDLGDAAGFV